MKNVAAFYAGKQAKPGFAKNKDLASPRREDLPRRRHRSAASRPAPGCHSPNGAGIPAQYPRLAGQHADYVRGAAGRLSQRRPRQNNPVMTGVAAKLNDREIKALSDYVAGLR